jgi:hypothetical protein
MDDIQEVQQEALSESHYKVLKLMGGDEVFCKVVREFSDALVVEMPMTIVKHQMVMPNERQKEKRVVEHTGLDRWMNYTHDDTFVIYKDRILSFGNLAPEVLVYYKMLSKKARQESGHMKDVEESDIMLEIQENLEKVAQIMKGEEDDMIEQLEEPIPSKRILH